MSARELVNPGRSPPEILMRTILFMRRAVQTFHNRLAGRWWRTIYSHNLRALLCSLKVRRNVCQQKRSQAAADTARVQVKLSPARCVAKRAARSSLVRAAKVAK